MKTLLFFFVISASSISTDALGERRKLIDNNYLSKFNVSPQSKHQARDMECPDAEDIYPCECFLLGISCSRVTSEEQLRDIFAKPFPYDNLGSFSMDQQFMTNNITTLNPGIFGTKTFQAVFFQNINFNFSLDVFDMMTSTLNEIFIDTAPFEVFVKDFSAFSQFETLILQYCPIQEYFVHSPTLRYLTLSWSRITEKVVNQPLNLGQMPELYTLLLQEGNLHYMPDITQYQMLDVYSVILNNISYIGPDMSTSSYLDTFVASFNNIENIEVGSIKVNYGAMVIMRTNHFKYIEESIWRDVFKYASFIELTENPFECGCDLAWIFRGVDTYGTPLLSKLRGIETCANGTLFNDLHPLFYINNCPS